MNVYGCLVRSSVPLFFMVSGMFMLDTNKELNLKKLFCHHILPILASLLLFQFFYDVFWFIGGNIKHFGETKLDIVDFFIDYFRHLLFAPYYHLWFLYTLIGLYILTPIIRVGLKNAVEKDIKYLMIVFFCGLCIRFCSELVKIRNDNLQLFINFPEYSGYIIYYLSGYYFSKYHVVDKIRKILISLGIISLVLAIVLTSLFSVKMGKPESILYDYLSPFTFFESIAVFLLIQHRFENRNNIKLIELISKLTFGVYLVHDFFLTLFWKIGISIDNSKVILLVPLIAVCVFILSLSLSLFLSKLPYIKKIIF